MKRKQPKKPPAITIWHTPYLVVGWFGLAGRLLIEVWRAVKRDLRKLRKR